MQKLSAIPGHSYALIPTGKKEAQLNSVYQGGSLNTYGLDAGYNLTPELLASVGYYYQQGDLGSADGSGVLGRLAYAINNGLTVGTNLSYDDAFKSRFSADIKWRFNTNGGPRKDSPKTNAAVTSLTSSPSNRDVRVHDDDNDIYQDISKEAFIGILGAGGFAW